MSSSAKALEPAFQGAGQRLYPTLSTSNDKEKFPCTANKKQGMVYNFAFISPDVWYIL